MSSSIIRKMTVFERRIAIAMGFKAERYLCIRQAHIKFEARAYAVLTKDEHPEVSEEKLIWTRGPKAKTPSYGKDARRV